MNGFFTTDTGPVVTPVGLTGGRAGAGAPTIEDVLPTVFGAIAMTSDPYEKSNHIKNESYLLNFVYLLVPMYF